MPRSTPTVLPRSARIPALRSRALAEVILHVRRDGVVAEAGPLVVRGRTQDEALERLNGAHDLYRLLLVRPDSPSAQRLAAEINALYAA